MRTSSGATDKPDEETVQAFGAGVRSQLQATPRAAMVAIAIILFGGCGRHPSRVPTAEAATVVTDRFWSKELPQVELRNFTRSTLDKGDHWQVTYVPRHPGTGAAWVFEVDKATGRLVSAQGGQ
jgi:hypothetical protein